MDFGFAMRKAEVWGVDVDKRVENKTRR